MSRARQCTHAWLVADNICQAADDLRTDWSAERTPNWALDTGLPGDAEATRELGPALPMSDRARLVAIALAQTKASRDALRGLERTGRAGELGQARAALVRAEHDLSDLHTGDGAYCGTEAGRAVSDLGRARALLTMSKWTAEQGRRWRERRAAAKESAAVAVQLADAEGRWETFVAPEVARLEAAIYTSRQEVEGLVASQEREAARWRHLAAQGHRARHAADQFTYGLAVYREGLEGEEGHTPRPGRRPLRPASSVALGHYQPPIGRELGPDL